MCNYGPSAPIIPITSDYVRISDDRDSAEFLVMKALV
jgi:hypothetical protein